MVTRQLPDRTRVLLSFSGGYFELARRVSDDLATANIEVVPDQWHGGGGIPATPASPVTLQRVRFLLPLLTPSDAAATWMSDEWRRDVYDRACSMDIDVLPLRGAGDDTAIPEFLRDRSYADLRETSYAFGFRRLVDTLRARSGDTAIALTAAQRQAASPSPMTLTSNAVTLELGHHLAPLLEHEADTSHAANTLVAMMFDGLFYELGVRFPSLAWRVTPDVPPSSFRVVINEIPEQQFELDPQLVLVDERAAALATRRIAATPAVNPATGTECAWIHATDAPAFKERGATMWEPREFMFLALSSLLRRKASEFIGIHETQAMLDQLATVFPELVAETTPKTVSVFTLTDVLRRLLRENVGIRNLRQILMALADWGRVEKDARMLTEYVRVSLQRQITYQRGRGRNEMVVFLLHPDLEKEIADATTHTPTGSYVDLEPIRLRQILQAFQGPVSKIPSHAAVPEILTTMEIRSDVRRLVALSIPRLHVMSYHELAPGLSIQPVGRFSLDGFEGRAFTVDDDDLPASLS